MIRRLVALALIGAGAATVYGLLPPRPRDLGPLPADRLVPVRGVIHVHTTRSDGGGTLDEVAGAAARAGLQFVIVTDHGDASRAPDPPSYRAGVLCIDAVEISTGDGHVVALDLPQSPYPLGGEGRDVVEDVSRLGGFSIAAHPASVRPSLRWTEWTAPLDGIEWLNGDSEWRDESRWDLARALLTYPVRPAASLARLLDRAESAMRRWDALTQRRRVVAVAASDAHARIGRPDDDDPSMSRLAMPLPGYEAVFRTLSIVLPDVRLSGRPQEDARAVTGQIRLGHVYSEVQSVAAPGTLAFAATSGRFSASAGDVLGLDGDVQLRVDAHAPRDARVVLFKDGERLASAEGPSLQQTVEGRPGVYRVEVEVPGSPGNPPVPWMVSNPIYVGRAAEEIRVPPRAAGSASTALDRGMSEWTVEHSAESQGALDIARAFGGAQQIVFRYALSGTLSSSPYAALVIPTAPGLARHDRLTFRVRADRPMRLSVQLRDPGAGDGDRWHRSIYVDSVPREVSVFFDEMRSRGRTSGVRPPLDRIRSILFVADTLNAKSGTNGQVVIEGMRYGK